MPIEQNIKTEDNPFLKTYPLAEAEDDRRFFKKKLHLYYMMSSDTYDDFDDMFLPLFNAIKQEVLKANKAGLAIDDETILGEIFTVVETKSSYQALCKKFKELKKQSEDQDRESHTLDLSEFCESCLIFDCMLHKPPIKYQRRHPIVSSKIELPKEPCKNHCFLLKSDKENNLDESMEPETIWSSSEKSYFELLHTLLPKHYCRIAQKLETKTCQEVQKFAFVNICDTVSRRTSTDSESSKSSRQSSPRVLAPKWKRTNEKLCAYEPCNHDGNCSVGCPCFDRKNFCEVFCGCTEACSNRHGGLLMIEMIKNI